MDKTFSSVQRTEILNRIADKKFDMIIIGGGITGAGIALDAASRGINTVLFDMQDFAAGTSSRSTKLVHGGLRYLKQFEVKMVAEVGKERAIVYENGPHVTTPEWMLLPIYKEGTFGKCSTSIGLMFYDYLAAVKKSERRRMLSREETLQRAPLLKKEGLLGGGYYVEYRTDDARLTMEVVKEAVHRGATALNYTKVDEFIYTDGRMTGVLVTDIISGSQYRVYADKIVNAAGPWVDTLREKDNSRKGKKLQHTKGVHLVFDQVHFPLKQAIYFDTPDGRMVFAIPRDGKTYVGTTDTVFEDDLVHPRMTVSDREYILKSIHFMFPELNITDKHIESSWTGLRPLIYEEGKSASEISRKDEIWHSFSGLITIAGGKLTGYRKMAEMVVDLVSDMWRKEGKGSFPACQTRNMPISGGKVDGSAHFPAYVQQKAESGGHYGLTRKEAENLVRLYGSNIDRIFLLADRYGKGKAEEYNLPFDTFLMLIYAMEEEMAVKPIDFFLRRTGALLFNRELVMRHKAAVIDCMARWLQWTDEIKRTYSMELDRHLHEAVTPIDVDTNRQ